MNHRGLQQMCAGLATALAKEDALCASAVRSTVTRSDLNATTDDYWRLGGGDAADFRLLATRGRRRCRLLRIVVDRLGGTMRRELLL